MNEISLNSYWVKSIRAKTFILLILFVLGISCTFQNENDIPEYPSGLQDLVVIQQNCEPQTSIELIRDVVIDDSTATRSWFNDFASSGFAFGGVDWFGGIEVDVTGKIFVGDRYEKVIHVFDSTGKYLQRLGGEGNGPGEFNGILDIKIQSDQLFVFDYFQFRTTFFSLDSFNLIEVQNAYLNRAPDSKELTGWHAQKFKLLDDESFLVGYMGDLKNANFGTPKYNLDKERSVRYYVVDREGKILFEKIIQLKDQKIITADVGGLHLFNMRPLPFLNQPLISISDNGHIFTANSEASLIRMHAPNGDYLRAFYIPLDKKELIRNEIIELYGEGDEENQNLLLHAELPEKWPALGGLVTDDENRLWVATIPDSEALTYEWWVLQDTGELIAKFKWPGNRSIERVKNGYVYARETEESTGLQTIVMYWIKMKKI